MKRSATGYNSLPVSRINYNTKQQNDDTSEILDGIQSSWNDPDCCFGNGHTRYIAPFLDTTNVFDENEFGPPWQIIAKDRQNNNVGKAQIFAQQVGSNYADATSTYKVGIALTSSEIKTLNHQHHLDY
eukprot:scaffold62856_cov43-Attheya_sp.AAC.1